MTPPADIAPDAPFAAPLDAPFDAAAADYDERFSRRTLGRLLRSAVQAHLFDAFAPGARVLELGCGTGEDAVALARRGVFVHATDAAPAMLDVAREKVRRAGLAGRVACARYDFAALAPDDALAPAYDGAFSNFGALNVLSDVRPLARLLARRVRPGGRVVLVVMGPLCPWEWGWYGVRGRAGTALRRLRPGRPARLDGGRAVRVWYPSPRRLRRAFAPGFRPLRTVGVGVVLPPSFAAGLVERWPRLFDAAACLDPVAGRVFPGTWLNDHYLVDLERNPEEVHDA